MKKLIILSLLILSLTLTGCTPAINCDSTQVTKPCPRVLFIGNSYTYVNDLPGMFTKLAKSGGHRVETGMLANGSWLLADYADTSDVLHELQSSRWDYVVLQEQSEVPAFKVTRALNMYPAARTLVQEIRQVNATPIFFVTWAHRDGDPDYDLTTYEAMQYQIDQGYLGIAYEVRAPLAPVGFAWQTVRSQNPELNLWQDDGSHPNTAGTYLAACVFYAVIFQESPVGLSYRADLSKDTVQLLQTVAADTVLTNPGQWNLP